MSISKRYRPRVGPLALAIALATLSGCDSNTPTTAMPPTPAPVANPSPDNKVADITIENEAANMDRLKKAGVAK